MANYHSIAATGVLAAIGLAIVPLPTTAGAEQASPEVSLFDSKIPSAGPLSPAALARRSGWPRIAEENRPKDFTGDAVVLNNRLAVVLRRSGPGAELYAFGDGRFSFRATLAPGVDGAKLQSVRVGENTPSLVAVEAGFQTPDAKRLTLRYELALGQPFVTIQRLSGVSELSVVAPCRFAVLPDFFADDIVVDARELPVSTAELPSENFLLQMISGGNSIVMTVAGTRDYDARAALSGKGSDRMIQRTRLRYGKDGRIWVAILEAPGIWHERTIAKADLGKTFTLPWTWPFAAQWRVDWRQGQMTGSWEMPVQLPDGSFVKYGWFGPSQTLTAERFQRYAYPCWVDTAGHGCFRPPRDNDFRGPAILYPINRAPTTPLDRFSVVDLVRATLGVGPCEYVLDVEGQHAAYKGRATCGNREVLNRIYAANKQKSQRAEIERSLREVVVFVKHIRARIDEYVAFGHAMRAYLAQQRKLRPELTPFLDAMDQQIGRIDVAFERKKSLIQTPQRVVDLTDEFRRTLIDYEGPDALEKCKAINEAIVVVGGNQDGLVCDCRRAVKVLRQRAGLAMATQPDTIEVAKEIRRRTQDMLRNPVSYEHPRP